MKKTTLSLLAISLILSTSSAMASDDQNSTKQLESISVTDATDKASQRDDLKLDSSTNLYKVEESTKFGTEVIDAKQIEAYRAKDVFDLLNQATGLDLTYQGRKSPYFLNMRGGGNVTYILDGAILPSTSNRILQNIPMIAIEEIQIVRSSTNLSIAPSIDIGASNSGSGTNIGFIIIRTKEPKKTEGIISTYLEQAVSQPYANGQNVYVGTRFGDSASLNGYVGGMFSRYDRPSKDTWFDGSNSDSGMFNGGLNYGRFSLNLMGYKDTGRFEMQRGETVTGTLDTSKWYYDPIKTTILSADGNMAWNENQVTLFSLSSTSYEQYEHDESFANNTIPAATYYKETTETYSLRHNAKFGDTSFQFGGQFTHSNGFGPNLSSSYNRFDTTVSGFSASVEQKLFDEKLTLDAGYRRDVKHVKDSSTSATKNSSNNDVNMAPANVLTLGAVYNFNDIYALNGRYFKSNEGTSGDFDLKSDNNAALHEEKQTRYEVGVAASYTSYFKPMLTYFDVKIDNQKAATTNTYTDTSGNIYYTYDELNSHIKGLELSVNGKIKKDTTYKFSWTNMISNEIDSYTATTYNTNGSVKKLGSYGPMVNGIGTSTPRNIYSVLITHAWDAYRASVSVKKADPYTSSTSAMGVSTNVNLGDYTRVDANIARDFKLSGYTATAKLYGRNLTNDQYATRYTTGYYYDRGRTLGVELSLAF